MDYGMWNDRTNMSMLTDFYELTMANGYLNSGNRDKVVYSSETFPRTADMPLWQVWSR